MNNDKTGVPIFETRRSNLIRLMNEKFEGKQKHLATAVNRQPDYIWRVLKKQKGFGETLARDIETILLLPKGWLDDPANSCEGGKMPIPGEEIFVIPMIDEATGGPSETIGLPIRHYELMKRSVKLDDVVGMVVCNHSMSMSIPLGDTVLLNKASNRPIDGMLFYIDLGGSRKIRRLAKASNGLWSMNSDSLDKMRYPDTQVPEEELNVLAEVFYSSGTR